MTHPHSFQKKELIQLIAIAAIFLAVIFVISIINKQQDLRNRASERVNCGNPNNLLNNCDFASAVNFSNANAPDWRDVRIDPERNAGANQYTADNKLVSRDGKIAAEIGKIDSNLCSLPKINEGYRIRSGIIQSVDVLNAETFNLSFDMQMESSHSYSEAGRDNTAAPFYVWTGFQEYKSDGKEIFLAYTPHNEKGEDFCSEPIRSDYTCEYRPDLRGTAENTKPACNGMNTAWKNVTLTYTRAQLCGSTNQNCIANAKRLFVSFGVTNNYNTVARVTNVVLTANGITPQTGVSSVPTATSAPAQAEVSFYLTEENSTTPLTSLTKKVGETAALNLHLDTKGKNIAGFQVDITIPDDWTVGSMGDGEGANRFTTVATRQVGQTIRFSKYNLVADVQGNLLLATIRLTAKKPGSGQIKFKYTEAITQSGLLTQEYQNINYTITNASGGTSGGTTPGVGTPASNGKVLVCPTAAPGKQIQITNCVVVTVTP